MKKILFAIILIAIAFQLYTHRSKPSISVRPDANQIANGALAAASMDVGALHLLSDRIEKACDRNRFGLSESACVEKIHARKGQCAQATAQHFPGQINDVSRLQDVSGYYVDCIFKESN